MDTGIAPPSSVAVLRVCNGMSRRETFTSSDGSFSFTVGDRATDMVAEASQDTRDLTSNGQFTPSNPMMMGQGTFQSPIADCELRADLSGYASTSIRLDTSMANSNVGIIMLHTRGKKAEGMISVASLEVPSKARKEFEKGSEQLEKGDLAADTLLYKMNNFLTFVVEESYYRTRALPLTATGLFPAFAGRPRREWKDVRSEFGPLFTF